MTCVANNDSNSTAHFAARLVSRFEIYFANKIQSSAFAPGFQNPSEATKRCPKTARNFKSGAKATAVQTLRAIREPQLNAKRLDGGAFTAAFCREFNLRKTCAKRPLARRIQPQTKARPNPARLQTSMNSLKFSLHLPRYSSYIFVTSCHRIASGIISLWKNPRGQQLNNQPIH